MSNYGDYIDSCLRGDGFDDLVNKPRHYQLVLPDGRPIEVIDFIQAVLGDEGTVAYCRGAAIKYLGRAGKKAGNEEAQDLRKAAWYCTHAAHVLEDLVSGK